MTVAGLSVFGSHPLLAHFNPLIRSGFIAVHPSAVLGASNGRLGRSHGAGTVHLRHPGLQIGSNLPHAFTLQKSAGNALGDLFLTPL